MKSAAKTLRDIAVRRATGLIHDGYIDMVLTVHEAGFEEVVNNQTADEAIADKVVGMVFEILGNPDREMVGAGRGELTLALPQGVRKRDQENLARVVWAAMLHRAGV